MNKISSFFTFFALQKILNINYLFLPFFCFLLETQKFSCSKYFQKVLQSYYIKKICHYFSSLHGILKVSFIIHAMLILVLLGMYCFHVPESRANYFYFSLKVNQTYLSLLYWSFSHFLSTIYEIIFYALWLCFILIHIAIQSFWKSSLIIILKIMNFVHPIYLEKFSTQLKSNIYKSYMFANSEGTSLMFDKFVL